MLFEACSLAEFVLPVHSAYTFTASRDLIITSYDPNITVEPFQFPKYHIWNG